MLISLLVISFAIFLGFRPAEEYISLADAVKNGAVSYSVSVNEGSTHYIKPLNLTVKNIRSTPVKIKVPNGFKFLPEDDKYQDIIITQEEMLALNPGKSLTIPLHGMCTENTDKGPSGTVQYVLGQQSSEKVTKLTQYIQRKKLFDTLGQSAVWAMTCNTPIEYIAGFDTTAAKELITYVANALGKPIPPPPAPDDTRRNYYTTNYKSSMGGSFNFNFSKTTAVTIAMFTLDNIVVRELYRNPAEAPGKHKLEYKFDATEYTDDFYYMRLIADGEIVLSGKIDNRDMFNQENRN